MSDIELTETEKTAIDQMVTGKSAEMVITFSIKGLERFSGSGSAVLDMDTPEEVQKMQATHAVSAALLEFYHNFSALPDTP